MKNNPVYQHEYYLINKEQLAAYRKKWAQANKEKIQEQRREHLFTDETFRLSQALRKRDWYLEHRATNPLGHLVRKSRITSKKRGILHTISEEHLTMPEVCPILGTPFSYTSESTCPSIDRIDNTKGYIPGNVWIISTLANRMKNSANKEQLIQFAKGVLACQDLL